jgi:multiple antibiotic resistance protein
LLTAARAVYLGAWTARQRRRELVRNIAQSIPTASPEWPADEGTAVQDVSFARFVTDLVIGYMTLFSIINPFGISFIFLNMTRGLSEGERAALARKVGVFSFGVMVTSLFVGAEVMRFFGITVPALRIAGGLVVALSGWSMLTAPDDEGAHPLEKDSSGFDARAFFPLTVPLTTGPGTIAAAIALGATRSSELRQFFRTTLTSLLIAILVAVTIAAAYTYASTFSRWMGREGTRVITRLTAFLLMCVGVQIVLTGLADALPAMIASGIAQHQQQP